MLTDLYQKYIQNNQQISTDTRTLKTGDLFFALKGDSFNGNKYAAQAIKKGASCAIIDEERYKEDERYFLVDDVLTTLQKLARFFRGKCNIPFIALTGSNGKTTTKELLKKVLEKKYKVHATIGNLNNHIGVPLTILSTPRNTDIVVIEMGANKIGDIQELCQIAMPSHGLITNIGHAHLEGFGNFEGVLRGKTELYDFLIKNNGIAFINSDDRILSKMAERFSHHKAVLYGKNSTHHVLENIPQSSHVKFKDKTGKLYQTHLVGEYNFSNIQAAQAIGYFFGISVADACDNICNYIPNNHRSQLVKGKTNHILVDAYNANPSSMLSAITAFDQNTKSHKTVILGDMLELGRHTITKHQEIIDLVKKSQIHQIILCGKNFGKVKKTTAMLHFETTEELKKWMKDHPIQKSYILMKGSRGMKLEKLIDTLQNQ